MRPLRCLNTRPFRKRSLRVRAEAGRALGGYRIDNASLPEVKIANILVQALTKSASPSRRSYCRALIPPTRRRCDVSINSSSRSRRARHSKNSTKLYRNAASQFSPHPHRQDRVRSFDGRNGSNEEGCRRWDREVQRFAGSIRRRELVLRERDGAGSRRNTRSRSCLVSFSLKGVRASSARDRKRSRVRWAA